MMLVISTGMPQCFSSFQRFCGYRLPSHNRLSWGREGSSIQMTVLLFRCSLRQQCHWLSQMPQCTGGPASIHTVLPLLVCQKAMSVLEGSGGSGSSAASALLPLEMCCRAHWRMIQLGRHVMSGSAAACPQSHNDHLVLSRKEVVCILR